MSIEVVDLEQIIRDYIYDEWLESKQRKEADMDLTDIKWDYVRFTHYPAQYKHDSPEEDAPTENGEAATEEPAGGTKGKHASPNAHVIFTAYFTNNTDEVQTHTLTTERRTKSTCTVSLSKSYTLGASVNIRLTPPNPIVEANAGFKGELSKMKGLNDTFEKELSWSVNSQIKVPKRARTRADLVIKEDEYDGHFTMDTKIEGKVVTTVWDKQRRNHVSTSKIDVKTIFKTDKRFRVEKTGVFFRTEGNCKCRFGIEQRMDLTELSLED